MFDRQGPSADIIYDRNMGGVTPGINIRYNFTCPGPSIITGGDVVMGTGLALAFDCPMPDGTTAIFFNDLSDVLESPLNRITCNVSSQMGDVNIVLHPDTQAFKVKKKNALAMPLSPFARNLTSLTLGSVMDLLKHVPVAFYVQEASLAYQDNETNQDDVALETLSTILPVLYEFEASYKRFKMAPFWDNGTLSEIPSTAKRAVRVVLSERTIGWEVKWPTWLGLVPMVALCAITFTMIAMALLAEGELTAFDPMSPVLLLAATSVGRVAFSKGKTVGDPSDENVLVTRISYAKKDQTWGLWSSERRP